MWKFAVSTFTSNVVPIGVTVSIKKRVIDMQTDRQPIDSRGWTDREADSEQLYQVCVLPNLENHALQG